MDDHLNLYKLYESCPPTSSNIIYCDEVGKTSISFEELRRNVDLISSFLDSLHLSKSTICCLIRSSLDLPAVMLGIMKISSTFAMLDTFNPLACLQAYQKYMSIKTLLVEKCYLKDLKPKLCGCWKRTDQLHLNSAFVILQSYECKNVLCRNSKSYNTVEMKSEIAYAIQTSATTGEPKVVQVPHECIAPNIIDFKSKFNVSTDDVILQYTSSTFDPSIIEIFLALSTGASLVLIPNSIRTVPRKIIEVIIKNNITILQVTPSLMYCFGDKFLKNVLLHKDSVLRILVFQGEVCPSLSRLLKWKDAENKTEIHNVYGITEASCFASSFKIDFQGRNKWQDIPLGEPLLNTTMKILNEAGEIADKGELYLGGYKRFCIVDDEGWPENADHFMRATGDLVEKTSDGFLFFEGRKNGLIKYKEDVVPLIRVNTVSQNFPEAKNHFLHFDCITRQLYLFVVWDSEIGKNISEMESTLLSKIRSAISVLPPIHAISVPFIPLNKHGKGDGAKLMSLVNKEIMERVSDGNCEEVFDFPWKGPIYNDVMLLNDAMYHDGPESIYG